MITEVTIKNSYNNSLKIDLTTPELSGYAITSISGLNPTDVDLKMAQMASGLRYIYTAGFHKFRTIGFNIIYYEDNICEDASHNPILRYIAELRDNLYLYFKPNDKIEITMKDNFNRYFRTEGIVSKHESTIFSKGCGAAINVDCPFPFFYEGTIPSGQSQVMWERVEYINGSEMATLRPSLTFTYNGNFETGFEFVFDIRSYPDIIFEGTMDINLNDKKLSINIPEEVNYFKIVIDAGTLKVTDFYGNNRINWVDANDITSREDFPVIRNGENTISLYVNKTEEAFLEKTDIASIKFKTLVSGV